MYNHLVLFDIGSVLVKLNFSGFYRELAALSVDQDESGVKQAYISSGLEGRFLRGNVTAKEFFEELRRLLHIQSASDAELRYAFSFRLDGQVDEVVKLKRRIHLAGYKVGIFSNTTSLDFENISTKWPDVLETYGNSSPSIYSFRHRSVKPEPEMYRLVGNHKTVTFIDDKESYLRTGIEQFGWNGILFTPFIDKSEAIRAVHTDLKKPIERFREAGSVAELVDSLNGFGIMV